MESRLGESVEDVFIRIEAACIHAGCRLGEGLEVWEMVGNRLREDGSRQGEGGTYWRIENFRLRF